MRPVEASDDDTARRTGGGAARSGGAACKLLSRTPIFFLCALLSYTTMRDFLFRSTSGFQSLKYADPFTIGDVPANLLPSMDAIQRAHATVKEESVSAIQEHQQAWNDFMDFLDRFLTRLRAALDAVKNHCDPAQLGELEKMYRELYHVWLSGKGETITNTQKMRDAMKIEDTLPPLPVDVTPAELDAVAQGFS
jgi:hypothetical protein